MKKTELVRKTPMRRTAIKSTTQNLKRARIREAKPKPPRRDGVNFPEKIKEKARYRAGFQCEVKGPHCNGRIEQFHHRRMRSQGGVGTLVNCLCVCGPDHTLIHQKTDWAYRHGLLVKSWLEPHEVDVHAACGTDCARNHLAQ
jgi:hypothetical protein